jgi:hypothetical protein
MTKEIVIIDGTTGEQVQREMTAEELAEYDYRWRDPKELEAEAKAATDKAALLAKLGITEDEARLLLGGN